MQKKWMILIGLILVSGLAFAASITYFNNPVEINTVSNRALAVYSTAINQVDYFVVDTQNAEIQTTTLVPISGPASTIGKPGYSYRAIYGTQDTVVATVGNNCTRGCQNLNGFPQNAVWSCVKAFYPDNTPSTCSDVQRMRNCVCKN